MRHNCLHKTLIALVSVEPKIYCVGLTQQENKEHLNFESELHIRSVPLGRFYYINMII